MLRLVMVVLVLVAACDSGPRYVGVGDVLEADAAARTVRIRHDRIAGLAEAGTAVFAVPADQVRAVLVPGVRVRFELRRRGGELVVTRANTLAQGNPGIHDHTPHHGGVVAMAGMLHLEAKAAPDGRLQLYLTDVWRRPLPLDDVRGSVTLDLPDGRRSLPLAVGGEALEAQGPPLTQASINAAFALRRAGQDVDLAFLLPLQRGDTGAAGIPVAGCLPSRAGNRGPRCTLRFARPVVAVALAPDAATLLVAQVDFGISAWRLPAAEFSRGLAPPPAVTVPVDEPPHPEAPNAMLVRPAGGEAVVAMENRLIVYSLASGEVLRAFAAPGGIVRALAWSPDGGALLVASFYDPAAYLLDAADGRVRQRFPIEREGAAAAFAPDGRTLAVASETGPAVLFAIDPPAAPRVLRGTGGALRSLAFAGDRLIGAGDDGFLRIWNRADGVLVLERRIDRTVRAMTVRGEGGLAAAVGREPAIQIVALSDGSTVGTLAWHADQILSLAWAGTTLVSGDSAGHVALWDVPDGEPSPP
jgi:DNA-binding beta-propeller fold protein YncE